MAYGRRLWNNDWKTLVAREDAELPRRTFRLADIEPGWHVLGNDARAVGTVMALEVYSITVNQGILRPRLHVPFSAVGEVRDRVVQLNVPSTWIASLGWERGPRSTKRRWSR